MNNQRNLAKIAGYALVLMAIIAGFSFGFAYPKIYNQDQFELAQRTLTENFQLYNWMLLGILIVLLLDLLVSWALYLYFKHEHKSLALWSFILRVLYTMIFGIATCYLANNLLQSNTNNGLIVENYRSFQSIWSFGLIIFGIHLLLIGVLMKLHKLIPKILWILTIIAGASYVLVHTLKTIAPSLRAMSEQLNIILALPMALGEIGLAIWLIIKGGQKARKIPD
ncbi:MAG: DUF4386 domain-containing protein [Saprospiraceae bacterium]|nr:DUF4386 domain-containing protein [Saprospiraceae bacterium]